MSAWYRLPAAALITAILALTVKKHSPELSLLVSCAGCLLLGWLTLSALSPILELLQTLSEKAGLEPRLLTPLYKGIGLGVLTSFTAAFCSDAGQSALAGLVELGGSVLCVLVSLPLFRAVLALVEQLL